MHKYSNKIGFYTNIIEQNLKFCTLRCIIDYMKEYLSYFSAAAIWNIPYIEEVLGSEITETDSVCFTVSECSQRTQKKGRIIHLCQVALPDGAVISINGSRKVKM